MERALSSDAPSAGSGTVVQSGPYPKRRGADGIAASPDGSPRRDTVAGRVVLVVPADTGRHVEDHARELHDAERLALRLLPEQRVSLQHQRLPDVRDRDEGRIVRERVGAAVRLDAR